MNNIVCNEKPEILRAIISDNSVISYEKYTVLKLC